MAKNNNEKNDHCVLLQRQQTKYCILYMTTRSERGRRRFPPVYYI